VEESSQLRVFVHDVKRFALYGRAAVEQAPLQVYYTTLLFAPGNSVVKRQFDKLPPCTKSMPRVEEDRSALLQTLEGHSGFVIAVVFSPDSKTVASASYHKTVHLWDGSNGTELRTLHVQGYISTLHFSRDGSSLITNCGTYPTSLICNEQHSVVERTSDVSVKGNWIYCGEETMIWLPPDYRPDCIAVYQNIAVFGYWTGAVTMLQLAL
jgi:WD40 repeat protein